MEIGTNYKAKLIDITSRNTEGSRMGENARWAVVVGKEETIVALIEPYFQKDEGIAKGIAAALNSHPNIKLDVEI